MEKDGIVKKFMEICVLIFAIVIITISASIIIIYLVKDNQIEESLFTDVLTIFSSILSSIIAVFLTYYYTRKLNDKNLEKQKEQYEIEKELLLEGEDIRQIIELKSQGIISDHYINIFNSEKFNNTIRKVYFEEVTSTLLSDDMNKLNDDLPGKFIYDFLYKEDNTYYFNENLYYDVINKKYYELINDMKLINNISRSSKYKDLYKDLSDIKRYSNNKWKTKLLDRNYTEINNKVLLENWNGKNNLKRVYILTVEEIQKINKLIRTKNEYIKAIEEVIGR